MHIKLNTAKAFINTLAVCPSNYRSQIGKNVLAGGAFLFGEKALKEVVLKQLVERMRKRKDVYACKSGNKLQVSIAFTHYSCGRSRGCGLVMDSKGEKNSVNTKR